MDRPSFGNLEYFRKQAGNRKTIAKMIGNNRRKKGGILENSNNSTYQLNQQLISHFILKWRFYVMKTKLWLIGLLVCSIVFGSAVFGIDGLSENIGQGQVDWEKGVITVIGEGAAPENASKASAPLLAKRAAIMDAYRNAVEVINGIRIRSGSYVKDYTVQSDEIAGTVDGFIKGGQFEKPVYDSEGRCTIVLHLPVGGHKGLSALLYDPVKQTTSNYPTPVDDTVDNTQDVSFTGVIIDARNFGIRPALYPQVFDTDGFLLYGQTVANVADPGFTTIVAYSKTLESAKSLTRIGNNPLVIKATGSVKSSNRETTDVIVSSEDSKKIRSLTNKNDLLSKAAVVIVIN
jgi:hypothetical protein